MESGYLRGDGGADTAPVPSCGSSSASGGAATAESLAARPAVATRSRRIVFIDLARAITVLMMVQGHCLHVILDRSLKNNTPFRIWRFIRGLTAPMFLSLSGMSFAVATHKRWADHHTLGMPVLKRLRRFSFFMVLGYLIHLPVNRFSALATMSDAQWRQLLNVDVLQVISLSLITLQLLAYLTKRPRIFGYVCATIGACVFALTPVMRHIDWHEYLWAPLAAFLHSGRGSQFPVFGWAGFVLFGAGMGMLLIALRPDEQRRLPQRFAVAGTAAVLIGWLAEMLMQPHYPTNIIHETRIGFLLDRVGGILIFLAGFSRITKRLQGLPRPLQALAEESLVVYVVHLFIVYGSIWNGGFRQALGGRLTLGPTVLVILVLLATMTAVAYYWNTFKKASPTGRRLAQAAIAVALAIPLL